MKPKKYLHIPLWWPGVPSNWRVWLPSRGNVLFTLLVVAGLALATNVGAIPLRAPGTTGSSVGTIAYQGRLADASGNPLTGTYNMIFRLYDTPIGGAPLWQEQWTGPNSVRVSDGLFNIMLGSLTSIPQNVVTGHDSLFLGITVGTDDEMSPRVQLGSVPFAMYATLANVPDGSITTQKIAAGAATQSQFVSGPMGASTSSTQFVDMPGRIVTLTTTGGPVLLIFSGSHCPQASDVVVGYWRIIRDGTVAVAYNSHRFAQYYWATTTLFGMDTPPAGTHTYKVQWSVSSGTLYASEGAYSANFAAVEFKR